MNILNPVRAVWGAITGTLSQQTDLQDALDAKADSANPVFTGTLTAPLVSIDNPDGNADFYMAPSIGRVIHVGATTNDSFGIFDATNAKWLFQVSNTDAVSFTGPVSASNFSGSSRGTNTGDQNLAPYALLSGAAFAGNISAKNLSGTNTGDQSLTPYALLSGAAFSGDITALNFSGDSSGDNTGDQDLSPYALLSGAAYTGGITVDFESTAQIVIEAGGGDDGANLLLAGDGGTTPNKFVRAHNGLFQIVNSAYTSVVFSISDVGNLTITGAFTASNFTGTSSGTNTGDKTFGNLIAVNGGFASDVVLPANGTLNIFSLYGSGLFYLNSTAGAAMNMGMLCSASLPADLEVARVADGGIYIGNVLSSNGTASCTFTLQRVGGPS